jgi:hypothetical protein
VFPFTTPTTITIRPRGRLLNDKKALSAQCEALIVDLKQAEEKHQARLNAVREGQDIAAQRQRDVRTPSFFPSR